MTPVLLFLAALGYILCGLLYCICYLWAYQPEKEATAVGFMVLGWPLYIVLEIVLQIAYGIGSVGAHINKKLKGARNDVSKAKPAGM